MRKNTLIAVLTTLLGLAFSGQFALAATGVILAPNQYAWDDNGGYVNWLATGGNVTVSDTALSGYIWSAGFGWINLSPSNGGVTNSGGMLSGYAWSTNTGYINFSGVTIDSNGQFQGHTVAQSTFGTMTFDCANCNVATSWRVPTATSGGTSAGTGGGGGGNGQIVGSGAGAPSSVGATTSASTSSQSSLFSLQTEIQNLTAQLAALTAARGGSASVSLGASLSFSFSRNLQLNATGADVRALQQYLNSHGFPVASAGTGSPGNETAFFGAATFRALKKFQVANGILATGYFGELTRAFVNSH